ncbi:ABC transporter permease [Desulforamulus ruminis]|uniref:NifC-like ABC-type porter n=2 Tax=Desulforamulus ruminis TaxID=1564 RepID=F6DVD8_DESRL|nr:NifC-like ABC-type porter [Desulforamulus ruminis DSM 2154]
MDLPLNFVRKIGNDYFQAIFWFILLSTTLFMLMLIVGLFLFGEWAAFLEILKNPEFHFAVTFTLWTSVLATLLSALTAVPCGYILSRCNFPGKIIMDTLLDVPIVLPPLVSGVALLIFFGPLFGESLARWGLDIVFSTRGVVVAQWFIAAPFAIKTFKQAFDSIDIRLEKVARTLGYTPCRVFIKVTLPLAKHGLLGGITMTWARALGEFGATAMLAGVTRLKTETLSVAIFLNMSIGDTQFALVTAIIMLMTALFLLILFKFFTGAEVRL